ncbi:FxsC protein [Dactylosporangium salmoneum]|uniref:FxsC protein n=1 Tax=Dactylosporangium salmoneum TaxID=53361 RepID=UPI0031D7F9DF
MRHFLFSYARQDFDPYLERFFTDLRGEARALIGCALEDAGFIDYRGVEVGDDWAAGIIDVACTCGVMVAVYSPTYFTRPYCGKEWAVMTARAGGKPGRILPVNWLPTPGRPAVASRPQLWGAALGEEYAERGLRWIVQRMGKNDDLERRYQDIVTELAMRIRDIVQAPDRLPQMSPRPTWDDIAQAFPDAAPGGTAPVAATGRERDGSVRIVVVAGSQQEMAAVRQELDYYGAGSCDWRPFPAPDDHPLSAYATGVLAGLGTNVYLQPAGRPLREVLDEAGAANDVVVVLVDAWAAGLAPYRDELRGYDDRNEVGAVVMVPRSRDDGEAKTRAGELDKLLIAAMPKTVLRPDPTFRQGSETLPAFRTDLRGAYLEAQTRVRALGRIRLQFPAGGPADRPRLVGP